MILDICSKSTHTTFSTKTSHLRKSLSCVSNDKRRSIKLDTQEVNTKKILVINCNMRSLIVKNRLKFKQDRKNWYQLNLKWAFLINSKHPNINKHLCYNDSCLKRYALVALLIAQTYQCNVTLSLLEREKSTN